MSSFGKVAGAIALLLLAAAGLLMSLCGGVFTYASVTTREMSGVWVISSVIGPRPAPAGTR